MDEAERQPYYHGLLPREDIDIILKMPGDYILRKSEPAAEGKDTTRKFIISLGLPGQDPKDPDYDGLWVKHFVIQPVTKPKPGFSIDGKRFYSSVMELLTHHINAKDPISKSLAESVLRNPVCQQPWELPHDSISKEKKLGEGQFGEVWKGKLKLAQPAKNGAVLIDVAIKIAKTGDMTKEKLLKRKKMIKEVMAEARIMRNYDHPNVVRLYGVAVCKEPLMIVMEFVTGGALDVHLKKEITTVDDKYNLMLGAAWGVEYLHTKGCIHRDLAARNCLVTHGVCKISDFGMSREGAFYKLKAVKMIPMRWCAPEAMTTFIWTTKSDVFSFGVLVWEIFSNGLTPWSGMTNPKVKAHILSGQRLDLPENMNWKLASIIKTDCWETNADVRKSMTEVARSLEEFTHLLPGENGHAVDKNGEEVGPAAHVEQSPRKKKRKSHFFF